MSEGGRVIDAAEEVLDRRIVDKDGKPAGTVDDLELRYPEDGVGPPYVAAIIAGPGALARRLGGRLGAWIESVHRRLHPSEQPGPARIPFGVVARIGLDVRLTVSGDDLEVARVQRWLRERIVAKIPGAEHAPE